MYRITRPSHSLVAARRAGTAGRQASHVISREREHLGAPRRVGIALLGSRCRWPPRPAHPRIRHRQRNRRLPKPTALRSEPDARLLAQANRVEGWRERLTVLPSQPWPERMIVLPSGMLNTDASCTSTANPSANQPTRDGGKLTAGSSRSRARRRRHVRCALRGGRLAPPSRRRTRHAPSGRNRQSRNPQGRRPCPGARGRSAQAVQHTQTTSAPADRKGFKRVLRLVLVQAGESCKGGAGAVPARRGAVQSRALQRATPGQTPSSLTPQPDRLREHHQTHQWTGSRAEGIREGVRTGRVVRAVSRHAGAGMLRRPQRRPVCTTTSSCQRPATWCRQRKAGEGEEEGLVGYQAPQGRCGR